MTILSINTFKVGRFVSSFCLLVLCVSLLASCASKSSSINDPNNPDVRNGMSESDLNYDRERRFADGAIPLPEGDNLFRDVRFGYDSSRISAAGRQDLEYNAEILRQNPKIEVQLEGHCDERGTVEYNLTLGDRRAKSVYELLVSLGIPPKRLTTISYGEELPLDDASNERAWAKNRRVHFSGFTR